MSNNLPKFKGEFDTQYKEKLFKYLVNQLPKSEKIDLNKIKQAYDIAFDAHKGILRKTEPIPYITHPVEVSLIVANEMGQGEDTIISALLHDVIEDSEYTYAEIEEIFGKKIAEIVDGVTKITKRGGTDPKIATIEKFIKKSVKQPEVILVKIADRLHNMRTMEKMPAEKQKIKSYENLKIYAPLAFGIGLYDIKKELEDLSFKYLYPERYNAVKEIVDKINRSLSVKFAYIKKILTPFLDSLNVKYDFVVEKKSYYNITEKFFKLQVKNKIERLEEIHNTQSLRIILHTEKITEFADKITDFIRNHEAFRIRRVKDWLKRPKDNGFRALVLDIFHKDKLIELQIITDKDHLISHKGYIDALWQVKNKLSANIDKEESAEILIQRLNSIINPTKIYVYTPQGHEKALPRGATVLDFAYLIHEEIGNHCLGATINDERTYGRNYELRNGEKVKILTSEKIHPEESWLQIVKTSKARKYIKKYLRKVSEGQDIQPFKEITSDTLVVDSTFKYKPAKCCQVLVDEEAIAIQELSGILHLHRADCPVAKKEIKTKKWAKVIWQIDEKNHPVKHRIYLFLQGIDKMGLAQELTKIISQKMHFNMKKFIMFADKGGFEGVLEIEILRKKYLENLINELSQIEGLVKIERINHNKYEKITKKILE